jgi:hypothetical protein
MLGPFRPDTTRVYFGGRSPLSIQRIALSVFIGSGRSQSKHCNVRRPVPPAGSVKVRLAPHLGQVGRPASPMTMSFAARTAFRPFQTKFNRENTLPGLGQASADLQVRRSGPARAAQPTGHRSGSRETVADPADDEGLRALGSSDGPPASPSQATEFLFLELNNFVTIRWRP